MGSLVSLTLLTRSPSGLEMPDSLQIDFPFPTAHSSCPLEVSLFMLDRRVATSCEDYGHYSP